MSQLGDAVEGDQHITHSESGCTSLASRRATSEPSLSIYGHPLHSERLSASSSIPWTIAGKPRKTMKRNVLELQTGPPRVLVQRRGDRTMRSGPRRVGRDELLVAFQTHFDPRFRGRLVGLLLSRIFCYLWRGCGRSRERMRDWGRGRG